MDEKEKVLLLAVQTQDDPDERFLTIISEMKQLIATAQGEVVATFIQKREKIVNSQLVGKGKLAEVSDYIAEHDVDVVITYQSLTGTMQRNLQEALHVRVIDRVQLILDIFALRARSKEGKLQVQLAQLQYLLPRLSGQHAGLSRLGGGIGTRGPGETKLEMDKRHLRHQIKTLEHQLADVSVHRQRVRNQRKNYHTLQIGLIGYTNAGKSTILNRLTGADTYEQDELFATLDPLTRKLDLIDPFDVTITDTVGFIQEIPVTLIHAFKSTLEESSDVDLLVHVVDASSPYYSMHEKTVLQLLSELKMNHIPCLTVYNKMDRVNLSFHPTQQPHIAISAYRTSDMIHLKETLTVQLKRILKPFRITISAFEQVKIVEVQKNALIERFDYDEEQNAYHITGYSKHDWNEHND